MNKHLKNAIISHILANFAIIKSDFITNKSKSLLDKDFLLSKKIIIEDDESQKISKDIYGCELNYLDQKIKIVLADCGLNKAEYCMIFKLKDCPIYGIYYDCIDEDYNLIACSFDSKVWLECNTYLQATFLAGMEQLKEYALSWNKLQNYQEEYNTMISFLQYQENIIENYNEG